MTETFTRWKLGDYIDSEERARGVLEAAAEEDPGDGTVICSVLSAIAKSKGMSALARDTGLNRGHLYEALSENGNPSLATVMKVARALGLRLRLESIEKMTEKAATPTPLRAD